MKPTIADCTPNARILWQSVLGSSVLGIQGVGVTPDLEHHIKRLLTNSMFRWPYQLELMVFFKMMEGVTDYQCPGAELLFDPTSLRRIKENYRMLWLRDGFIVK